MQFIKALKNDVYFIAVSYVISSFDGFILLNFLIISLISSSLFLKPNFDIIEINSCIDTVPLQSLSNDSKTSFNCVIYVSFSWFNKIFNVSFFNFDAFA